MFHVNRKQGMSRYLSGQSELNTEIQQTGIPNLFVVGYGLDYAERYRNLPFVGVLHPHIYKT